MSDKRTNLNELMNIPPRIDFETPEEYKERVVFEYANIIKEAIQYDISMGHVDWKKAQMGLDEFCIGWVDCYVDNVIKSIGFNSIPIM